MKYTDEEMAEAALLLAHTDTAKALPSELESTIEERGRTVAQDVRFSTTKAGAIEIEAPQPAKVIPIGRASRAGAWMGWVAAAACFAFGIYEWRTHVAETNRLATQPPAPTEAPAVNNGLFDRDVRVAEISVDKDGSAKLKVVHLKTAPRYQLWTSTSDAAHASPVGSFTCDPGCDGRELSLAPSPAGRPKWAWLTTVDGTPADSTGIVGSGGITGVAAGP